MFMPDLEENRRAPAFPFEDGAKRLEVRDPETLGRRAWGYLSKDERFILSDSGRLWLRLTESEIQILGHLLSDESSSSWLLASYNPKGRSQTSPVSKTSHHPDVWT